MLQPGLVVFKGSAFFVLAHTGPEASDQMGDAGKIHVHKNIFLHHYPLVLFSPPPDSLRQVLLFKLKAHCVVPRVR